MKNLFTFKIHSAIVCLSMLVLCSNLGYGAALNQKTYSDAQEAFIKADANRDGQIDRDELAAYVTEGMSLVEALKTQLKVTVLFTTLDTSFNNSLELDEFVDGYLLIQALRIL